jgi:hypothetical protein
MADSEQAQWTFPLVGYHNNPPAEDRSRAEKLLLHDPKQSTVLLPGPICSGRDKISG